MLDPALEIRSGQSLHEPLLLAVTQLRALHAAVSALMTDVAAMRRTLLQNPKDLVQYKNNLRSAIETAKPIVNEAMQSYDEMIQRIEESDGWRN